MNLVLTNWQIFHQSNIVLCAQHYDVSRFSILAQGRSFLRLSAIEAFFIKTFNHALCRQKEFIYSTDLRLCTNDAISLVLLSGQSLLGFFPSNKRFF